MHIDQFIADKIKERDQNNYITFNEKELEALRPDHVEYIVERLHGNTLVKLPDSEIKFFEWLKVKDRKVWDDLWDSAEDEYLVSIDYLRQFISESSSFHICDLMNEPNFWFSSRHIKPKGMEYLESILEKIEKGEKLRSEELLLMEINMNPIDIWHFCYHHNLHIGAMKQIVEEMVYNGWLVHLTDREDLVKYID